MKKLLIVSFWLISCFLWREVQAYSPTTGDIHTLQTLKTTLDKINSGNVNDMWNFITQIKKLQPQVGQDARISYLLQELYNHLYIQFSTAKIKSKESAKTTWTQFVNQYDTGIVEITMEDKCFGRYNTLDNISFANNFPTALTIATRYRESHCGYYLPNNGDGPFQILSKDYWTGEITENIFTQSVQDFIDFSKNKYANYKSKVDINISYTGTDIKSIVSHSALYNGWTISSGERMVIPNAPKYVYEGYANYNSWQYASWAIRLGLLPKFIKTLDFELKNFY
jgi:hypothetical protein